MTTVPDWVRKDAVAYVLTSHNVPGVGDYLTATKVEITFVGARDIRVKPYGVTTTGNESRFRTSDLTAPGTRGTWTRADVLVEPMDPRVATAKLRHTAARAVAKVNAVLNDRANRLSATICDLTADEVDTRLAQIARIQQAVIEAHSTLLRIRQELP